MLKLIPRTVLMAAAFFALVRLGGSWLANKINNWSLVHEWLGYDIKTAAADKTTAMLFEDVLQIGLFAAIISALMFGLWIFVHGSFLGRRHGLWDLAAYVLSYVATAIVAMLGDGAKFRPIEFLFYVVAGLLAFRLMAGKAKPKEDDEEEKKDEEKKK